MENRLGRLLRSNEIVHHVDGNKYNNNETNLVVLDRANHSKQHREEVAPPSLEISCPCGVKFNIKPHAFRLRSGRNKTNSLYCSRVCSGRFARMPG